MRNWVHTVNFIALNVNPLSRLTDDEYEAFLQIPKITKLVPAVEPVQLWEVDYTNARGKPVLFLSSTVLKDWITQNLDKIVQDQSLI